MKRRAQAGVASAVALTLAAAAPAYAQKPMSDMAVKAYMDLAWRQLPAKFTETDGEVITFDRTKPDAILVPVETAREVITAAHRSGRAQICNLPEDQQANFESLKARENAKKKWNKQQLKYMLMLHTTIVQLMAGKVKVTEREGDKVVSQEEVPSKAIKPCQPGEAEKLKTDIMAYVKAGPYQTGVAPAPPAPKASADAAPAKK